MEAKHDIFLQATSDLVDICRSSILLLKITVIKNTRNDNEILKSVRSILLTIRSVCFSQAPGLRYGYTTRLDMTFKTTILSVCFAWFHCKGALTSVCYDDDSTEIA